MTEAAKNCVHSGKVFTPELLSQIREIGSTAVWSLSSCKAGFGVEQLRADNLVNYWQSDGPQPHLIDIQFHKRTAVRFVSIYTDFKSDESYTPSKIAISVGNDSHDLRQVEVIELEEPIGWVNVELEENNKPIKTFMIQIAVLANHQSGRDTHLRLIKLYAPKQVNLSENFPSGEQFSSDTLSQWATVR